jgi:hypothetical protein
VPPGHLLEVVGRPVELLPVQPVPPQPQRQLGQEVVRRQVPLHPVVGLACLVGDDHGRGPHDVVGRAHLRLLLQRDLDRDEVLADERGDAGVRIRHGIHRHAGPSGRGSAEVEEHQLALPPGPRAGLLGGGLPGDAVALSSHDRDSVVSGVIGSWDSAPL